MGRQPCGGGAPNRFTIESPTGVRMGAIRTPSGFLGAVFEGVAGLSFTNGRMLSTRVHPFSFVRRVTAASALQGKGFRVRDFRVSKRSSNHGMETLDYVRVRFMRAFVNFTERLSGVGILRKMVVLVLSL
jgi:hypothetical protein